MNDVIARLRGGDDAVASLADPEDGPVPGSTGLRNQPGRTPALQAGLLPRSAADRGGHRYRHDGHGSFGTIGALNMPNGPWCLPGACRVPPRPAPAEAQLRNADGITGVNSRRSRHTPRPGTLTASWRGR